MRLFVLDVEAVGLWGPPFAVGWAILDGQEIVSCEYAWCDPSRVRTMRIDEDATAWIDANVLPKLSAHRQFSYSDMLAFFSREWSKWKADGFLLAADVPFPVETNFLISALPEHRRPYPLLDVASMVFALTGKWDENDQDDKNKHNPMHDAVYSAERLLRALKTGART